MIGAPGDMRYLAARGTRLDPAKTRDAIQRGLDRSGMEADMQASSPGVAGFRVEPDFANATTVPASYRNDRVAAVYGPMPNGTVAIQINEHYARTHARLGVGLGSLTETVADFGQTPHEVIERATVHESTHHFFNALVRAANDPTHPGHSEASGILRDAHAALVGASGQPTHSPSRYALDNVKEYICEAHTAHVFCPTEYHQLDPGGSTMIQAFRRYFRWPSITP